MALVNLIMNLNTENFSLSLSSAAAHIIINYIRGSSSTVVGVTEMSETRPIQEMKKKQIAKRHRYMIIFIMVNPFGNCTARDVMSGYKEQQHEKDSINQAQTVV